MRKTYITLISLFLIVLILITWKFYSSSIDISSANDQLIEFTEDTSKSIKYFGVVSRYTPREIFLGYQPIMDYLSENTPYTFELKLNSSYEGTARQLADGEIAIASLGSLVYASLKDKYDLEVILKPLNHDGNDYYRSMFITQDTSKILSINDLKNCSLLLPSKESLTGKWMPLYISKNIGAENTGISIEYTSHHTTVAEKVLQGDVDAGVVKEAVAKTFKDRGLRIFHIAPKRTTIPIVVSRFTSDEFKKFVIDALLKIDANNIETQKLLNNWDEELSHGFALAKSSDYQMVIDLLPLLNIK